MRGGDGRRFNRPDIAKLPVTLLARADEVIK
jgi:hypothetical protein